MSEVININKLAFKAQQIAKAYGDKGSIVINMTQEGLIRIGANGLTGAEMREALCCAIHYSFASDEEHKES